jgi:hypothetical protein
MASGRNILGPALQVGKTRGVGATLLRNSKDRAAFSLTAAPASRNKRT